MLIDLIPTLAVLVTASLFIGRHREKPVLQIYSLIVVSYLNIFPALDFYFSTDLATNGFTQYQYIVVICFELPMFYVASHAAKDENVTVRPMLHTRLDPYLPVVLLGVLISFWYVSFRFDLFFRRLGHEGLLRNTAEVPGMLLYLYRAAVETSFFVITFLGVTLRCTQVKCRYLLRYKLVLVGYLITFAVFFLVNSRMQFVLLLLCLLCTQPTWARLLLRRLNLMRFGLLLATLIVGLTVLRELYLEDNERVDGADLLELLPSIIWLITSRLDSMAVLYRLHEAGFDPFGFELSGLFHVLNFYISFFIDPAAYEQVKSSLVTSPTVEIVNRLLSTNEVDFPKSMILDMFLSFGIAGLAVAAILLGSLVGRIQRRLSNFRLFSLPFMLSLYSLPMFLEFEKEFIGLAFAFLKWTPMLALLYWLRPRGAVDARQLPSSAAPALPAVSM